MAELKAASHTAASVTDAPACAPDIRHLAYLDGWRGLAIALLLIGHFFPVPGINLGRVGVNFFFVLSGLLMSQLLFVKEVPIAHFYKRRISRVFPLFYVFLTAMVLIALALGRHVDWREVLSAALFVNNYVQGDSAHLTLPFGHIWSLSVEEQSYVLLSLIAVGARRGWWRASRGIALCVGLMILACICYGQMYEGSKLEFQMFYHSEIAAFGIFASALLQLHFSTRRIPALPAPLYPLLMLAALMLAWWSVPLTISAICSVGVLAVLVNLLAAAPAPVKKALSFYPLRQLGLWSFSLYIWQQAFYLLHYRQGMPSLTALALALATGICSYYLLEKPVRNYLNARWAGKSETDGAAPGLPISASDR
jgi:peptidoglycan/LPS O-acetylase OafA/YrhL